jgi:hypothetical protein
VEPVEALARPFALTLPILLLAGCSPTCGNRIISSLEAPGGGRSAVLFQRNCGATTVFSTQNSVLPAAGQPEDGNAFRADAGHEATVRLGAWGGPWAEMRWVSPRDLLIRYAAGARLFAREEQVGDVHIRYESVSR